MTLPLTQVIVTFFFDAAIGLTACTVAVVAGFTAGDFASAVGVTSGAFASALGVGAGAGVCTTTALGP